MTTYFTTSHYSTFPKEACVIRTFLYIPAQYQVIGTVSKEESKEIMTLVESNRFRTSGYSLVWDLPEDWLLVNKLTEKWDLVKLNFLTLELTRQDINNGLVVGFSFKDKNILLYSETAFLCLK